MFLGRKPRASRAKLRKTKNQRKKQTIRIFGLLILSAFFGVIVRKSFAEIINDVRVDTDAELTYYLNVKEDGVDIAGLESSDAQMSNAYGGRVTVTDTIPNGLIFQGFVTTANGTIGAVSRSDSSVQCPGRVVDDTKETAVNAGTWNNDHTEYYYHGLHYNASTRTVSFVAEGIKAGCQLAVGIITKTPATIDDPDTDVVETRRDFYNTAFAAEKDITAISNTVHAFIGESGLRLYKVRYSYTGDIPTGAPTAPSDEAYPRDSLVSVNASPRLRGYTFSGWSTEDVAIDDGLFEMPGQNVRLLGTWTRATAAATHNVTYTINGAKPADFIPPAAKEHEVGADVLLDSTTANTVIDGYKFSGWSTTDAELSETGFAMPNHDVTIVGSFERISYTVCYEFEGAIIPPNASALLPACQTHYPGDTVTTAANPSTSGYNFLGWYENATFTMPTENVVIQGEWGRAAGKFAPEISKSIIGAKAQYMYGETVKFKITVSNTAAFAITDVYLEEELAGAIFTASANGSYELRTNTIIVIPSITAGASVDVYAEYQVTENTVQTLTNIVELTGALAENYVLDTDREYKATIDFETIPEPAPLTGIIFNALPYVMLVALGASLIFLFVFSLRGKRFASWAAAHASRLDAHVVFRMSIPCFALIGILIGGLIAKNVSAEHYTEVIESVNLTSQRSSYANGAPGAWNVTKSAHWISQDKARITFDVDTIAKTYDSMHTDIVLVLDRSGSMVGEKIDQVKHDTAELIEYALQDSNNRIGIVSFSTGATVMSELTNDKDSLLASVNGIIPNGATNYYDGFLKAEQILDGYEKQDNRNLVLLFLTDGYPNVQTPNERAEYRTLKQMYPYMAINGVQYEMGSRVLDPIRRISDNQYIANMDSLNNVLFEAAAIAGSYDDFSLTDYIEDEYWDVASVNDISASNGQVSLSHDGGTPIVSWTMRHALMSGMSAQLNIDITIKNSGAIPEGTFLPTNLHETIRSSLDDVPDEDVDSALTPVLKSSFKVTYEPNLPNSCASYAGTVPAEQAYLPHSVVQISNDEISCDGYNFAKWEVATGSPKILNDDYFKILDDDVVLRATWTKISISKSMDGEVSEEAYALLDRGESVVSALKKLTLTGQASPNYNTANSTIKAIKSAPTMSATQQDSAVIISDYSSTIPIYAWFDSADGTIYIYSEAEKIKAGQSMRYMFGRMTGLSDISGVADWDVSGATDMHGVFYYDSSLTNLDALANWNPTSATAMSHMFYYAYNIADISGVANWDTSSLVNASTMFAGDNKITSIDALANWDTSSLTNIGSMFNGVYRIQNADALANWDTSNLTNISGLFSHSSATCLEDISALANWDASNITDMAAAFKYAVNLTDISPLANWDTSNVTNMNALFSYDSSLTDISPLANWDTSNVTNFGSTFSGASSLTDISPLANWNTSNAETVEYMFSGASSLTDISPLANWDTTKVTNMSGTFNGLSRITTADALVNWNTAKVTNMSAMFQDASSLADISALAGWSTSKVTYMYDMFNGASSLTSIDPLANWSTVNVTNMARMFRNNSSLTNIDALAGFKTGSVTNMSNMFDGVSGITNVNALANWNTSNVTGMTSMFANTTNLSNLDGLANWNTSKVISLNNIFYNATSITDIDALANWNTSQVRSMQSTFNNAASLTNIDGALNWVTSSVTNMDYMFQDAASLTNIDGAQNWDVSKVTTFNSMFRNTVDLTNIDGALNWTTSSVTNIAFMFQNATGLTNIDGALNWNLEKTTTSRYMFQYATSLTNIDGATNWTTSKISDMSYMFDGCTSLTSISGATNWDVSKVTLFANMFSDDINIASLNPIFDWAVNSSARKTDMFKNIPDSVTRPGWY